MNLKKTTFKDAGFTLVELAIVLMIIGLLIAGILRGQELVNNMRLKNIIKQVTSYQGAYYQFMHTYSAKPGDMSNVSSRIPGCQTGNPNNCRNGDGDGIVGAMTNAYANAPALTSENTQFWKHLALSHLISGVDGSTATISWGKSHPASPISSGYSVITSSVGGVAGVMQGGLTLRLHNCLTCANIERTSAAAGTNGLLTPLQAKYVDDKMDDGQPKTGDVQATAYDNGAISAPCEVAYTANESSLCVMYFLMNR